MLLLNSVGVSYLFLMLSLLIDFGLFVVLGVCIDVCFVGFAVYLFVIDVLILVVLNYCLVCLYWYAFDVLCFGWGSLVDLQCLHCLGSFVD